MRKKFLWLVVVAALAAGAVFWRQFIWTEKEGAGGKTNRPTVTIIKSPDCGCCVSYSAYLRERGFATKTENRTDMDAVKTEYQIPQKMQSCHTALWGDYFVEGHVPLEAVEKLLAEKPAIDGIALPEMPSGSPGMPGEPEPEFEIYALTGGGAA
ncbi:MAG: hypothetical protein COU85_00500, partial [Candidatus Portnoybacteria bacterium CG10_big_fil_rev_8_21_14_0_10_44_7]